MFPSEPDVRNLLRPYEPALCAILTSAWRQVAGLPGRATFDFKRTVATLMHQLIMNGVRSEFADSKDVRLLEGHETIRLLVERQLVIRLKKMDRRGHTRAAPTQATLAFTNELPLPFASADLPDVHTIDFGYVLNELETKIDAILVAARAGESVLWSYEPDDEADANVAATIRPTSSPPSSRPSATIIKLPVGRGDRKDDGNQ